MAYGGISAFVAINGKRKLVSEALDILSVELADKSPEELRTILAPDCQKIADLMDKADRVEDLERKVANLEYLLSEKADWYRQELAASEQRSKGFTNAKR